jgi:hypothetical protein
MKILVKVLLSIFLLLPAVTIAIARATLPQNACNVAVGKIDKLGLETMSYADVKAALGCDGILRTREVFGGNELVLETYSWRIAAWPYGRFDGEFINGKMHGKLELWFNLQLSGNKD